MNFWTMFLLSRLGKGVGHKYGLVYILKLEMDAQTRHVNLRHSEISKHLIDYIQIF